MDYSYFNAAPQQPPYHIYGLHAGTPHPDEFNGVSQPSVPFDYNYGSFPPSFSPVGIAPQHSPPESFTRNTSIEISRDAVDGTDDMNGDRNSGRGSSEEKEPLTPAQSRRKAQNRAAQRAFRERKERRVRELEQKLNDLEQTSTTLHADNERLKQELARIATENKILRATSSATSPGSGAKGDGATYHDDAENTTTGPMEFCPRDVEKTIADSQKDGNLAHRIVISSKTGEKLLNARATWDMIQNHRMYKEGLVDIGDVCDRLKGFAQCDGQGPVFEEGRVRRAIEESVASGSDELI